MLTRIYHIIRKDFLVGKRERQAFLASLLYLVAITFVVFKVFGTLEGPTRMGVFWIIMVFISINLVGYSFSLVSDRRRLNHYQLYDPVEFLLAKLLTNIFKLIVAGILLIGLFMLFSAQGLKNAALFTQIYLLASFGLVGVLTFVSSIAVYSSNQMSMVTILSLPLLIPVMMIGMRVSLVSERMFFDTSTGNSLLMLFGIDLLMVVLSVLFISFTWKP